MKKPIVALIYDFDKTLSTKDMQEFTFIPTLGMSPDEFWTQSDGLGHKYKMDHILAYMYLMAQKAQEKNIALTRDVLKEMGKDIEYYKGVETWFKRINDYGESLGLEVRHYIISCGLKPMIEGSSIAKEFYNIFACEYVYDEKGIPCWPSVAINYTSKTQFLYRINKGVEDMDEHKKLNMYMPRGSRAIPYGNMIYIGDGLTDVPSMKLTRTRGGYAVGVYENQNDAKYLVDQDRVDFYVQADYSEGSEMEETMKVIFRKIKSVNDFCSMSTSTANILR